MQFDADTVGAASPAADAEMCMMMADCLEALGIKRGDYVIKVNNRKVLDGVMEAIGLGGEENGGRRLTVLRAIDKWDRLGPDGVRALLGAGRKDESGDFTKGAGLEAAAIQRVMVFASLQTLTLLSVTNRAPAEAAQDEVIHEFEAASGGFSYHAESNRATIEQLRVHFGSNATSLQGIEELDQIRVLCETAGYNWDQIKIDPSVVRGLEYYTGPVFEAELTFETRGEDGKPIRFGSVGGGGRYDGLVARFRAEPVPATGFSIGISRLLAALRAIDSPIVAGAAKPGPVVVAVLDRECMADYQRLVARLREAGIAAEMYLGKSGLNAQLKYADRRGSLCAIIQGSNERDAPGGRQVVIRDLRLGAELAKASKDRADYVELRQKAQFAVAEAAMVARVGEILARR
jgi:histidyl-tRNA synthetase